VSAFDDLDRVIEQFHLGLDAFHKGDPEPVKALFSHREDVSLANPFGPPVRGWRQVAETMERAAAHYRDGGATGFERIAEYATPHLAYIVEGALRGQARREGRRQSASSASHDRPST